MGVSFPPSVQQSSIDDQATPASAVSEGSLPGLNPVEMLAAKDPSTDRYQFALTTGSNTDPN